MRNSNHFWIVIKLDVRKIVTVSATPSAVAKVLVTRMLTCDLFVVDNLLVTFQFLAL